ncbi:MAG: response regulator [candidate division WOR-3 bacterium]
MNGKILIIEDEKSLVEVIESILSEIGTEGENSYEVRKAYTASEGLKVASEFNPDVVLLDIRLPDRLGTEVLSALKEQDNDVQVIIMTAHATIETAIEAVREQAYDYIQKPLPSRAQFQTLINNALERRYLLLEKKKLLTEISEVNLALEEANKELREAKSVVDQKLRDKVEELSLLNQFSESLLDCNDLALLIERIPEIVLRLTKAAGVVLILKDTKDNRFSVHAVKGDVGVSLGKEIKVGEEPFGLVNNEGPWETEDFICSPLSYMGETLGVLALKKSEKEISPELIQTITNNISICLYTSMLTDSLKASYIEAVLSFVKFQESANPELKVHSERVGKLSMEIANRLGVPKSEMSNIRFAALLHDLGKVVRGEVHSELLSAEIISPLKFLRKTKNILEHLYENFDGSGKPDGQKGEAIPIGSRIVRVANEVDELLSTKIRKEEVIKKIEEKSGSVYDPRVVNVLKEVL